MTEKKETSITGLAPVELGRDVVDGAKATLVSGAVSAREIVREVTVRWIRNLAQGRLSISALPQTQSDFPERTLETSQGVKGNRP
jgi:hypothetical protein